MVDDFKELWANSSRKEKAEAKKSQDKFLSKKRKEKEQIPPPFKVSKDILDGIEDPEERRQYLESLISKYKEYIDLIKRNNNEYLANNNSPLDPEDAERVEKNLALLQSDMEYFQTRLKHNDIDFARIKIKLKPVMEAMGRDGLSNFEVKESEPRYKTRVSEANSGSRKMPTPKKIIWKGKSPEKQIEKLLQYWKDHDLIDMGHSSIASFRDKHFQSKETEPEECPFIFWRGNQNILAAYIMKLHEGGLIEYKEQGTSTYLVSFIYYHFKYLNTKGSYSSIDKKVMEQCKIQVDAAEKDIEDKIENSFAKQLDRIIDEVHSIYLIGEESDS